VFVSFKTLHFTFNLHFIPVFLASAKEAGDLHFGNQEICDESRKASLVA
jgi:hypothetical protein